MAAKELWALDFDGVICDSVGESSISGWKAASELWPEIFCTPEAELQKERVLEQMRTARPVIETGYENLIQVRCLLEGVEVEDILNNWHRILPEYMEKWGLERKELLELFGRVRDQWIERDLQGWLGSNRIYPGVVDALKHAISLNEVYIVTTKQARFTAAIMKDIGGISPDRILSTAETGRPKSEVLLKLEADHPGTSYHFVEDKFGTLEKVIPLPELAHWNLYLVDWGYNTKPERDQAESSPRVKVVGLQEFASLFG